MKLNIDKGISMKLFIITALVAIVSGISVFQIVKNRNELPEEVKDFHRQLVKIVDNAEKENIGPIVFFYLREEDKDLINLKICYAEKFGWKLQETGIQRVESDYIFNFPTYRATMFHKVEKYGHEYRAFKQVLGDCIDHASH